MVGSRQTASHGRAEPAGEEFRPRFAVDVPAWLTAPTPAYVRRVRLAMLGVLLLVAGYVGLTAWFVYVTWRLAAGLSEAGRDGMGQLLGLFLAFVLAVLLVTGLFSIDRSLGKGGLEVTAQQQPQLFAFLHELADAAGAPRPQRVFLSAGVNAAVFYDLSVFNLFLPARKNLELGLGLVNTLSMSELSAVIGHELGHFAQRSMALGRWVYLSRKVAERVIMDRGKLEQALVAISWTRYFWIGWLPRIMIWSVRALLGRALRGVELLQRALAREMEFQADLVAVSLTGSDALIHALHRLGPADEAWTLVALLTAREMRAGRAVPDMFELQAHAIARTGVILNDVTHGASPRLPDAGRAQHRVFRAELGDAPSMWSTHPANRDREDNAKQRYVPAELDERSAWGLFRDAAGLRKQVTGQFLAPHRRGRQVQALSPEEALEVLEKRLDRPSLSARYGGAYFDRSPVVQVSSAAKLYGPLPSSAEIPALLATLYSAGLASQLKALRDKLAKRERLRAHFTELAREGGGSVSFQGRGVGQGELRKRLNRADREVGELREKIERHDQACRTVHLAIARTQGANWDGYLENMAGLVHYAAHSRRLLEHFADVLQRVLADRAAEGGRLSELAVDDIERASKPLQQELTAIWEQRAHVRLSAVLRDRLFGSRVASATSSETAWTKMLPETLRRMSAKDGFGSWLDNLDRSVAWVTGALEALEAAALDVLLDAEYRVRQAYEAEVKLGPAPPLCGLPAKYTLIAHDHEAETARWWARRVSRSRGAFQLLPAALVLIALLGFTAAPAEVFALRDNLAVPGGLFSSSTVQDGGPSRNSERKKRRAAREEQEERAELAARAETAAKVQSEARAMQKVEADARENLDDGGHRLLPGTPVEVPWRQPGPVGSYGGLPQLAHGKHYRMNPGHDGQPGTIEVVSDDDLQGNEVPNPTVADNLAHAPNAAVRERLLALNVETSPPGHPDTAEWLEIATAEKRSDLLNRRLLNYPGDPETRLALIAVNAAR